MDNAPRKPNINVANVKARYAVDGRNVKVFNANFYVISVSCDSVVPYANID